VATKVKQWTLEEVHSLPDDGNKYELVRGELFVTPAPAGGHEAILARLSRVLEPYVAANGLGLLFHPRAVVRFEGSEVEPDLMVRQPWPGDEEDWDAAPLPVLIVEVFSDSTRRRDQGQKRDLYTDARIAEYWMLDPERRTVTIARPGRADETARDRLVWHPTSAGAPLTIQLGDVFARRGG
jgi:Uma2 family endonuclease